MADSSVVGGSMAGRLAAPLAVFAAMVGGLAYVGAVDPHQPGHYPACPLFRLTGLLCPGCGGLRSVHAMVHGELGSALTANALAVVGCALAVVALVVWGGRAVRGVAGQGDRVTAPPVRPGGRGRRWLRRYRWWLLVGLPLAAFTVVRNLPGGGMLRP